MRPPQHRPPLARRVAGPGRRRVRLRQRRGQRGGDRRPAPAQPWGADLARVFLPERDAGDLASPLSLPAHTAALEELVAQARARLLVIDPVMHFLGNGADLCTEAGLRRTLGPLAALARRHACVVLLLRHLIKTEGRRALYRGLGSIGLLGACRSAWLVAGRRRGRPGACWRR